MLIILASCSKRDDVLFSATDELHSLQLYSNNNDFEILYNGVNKAEGKYRVSNDTIHLVYNSGQHISSENRQSEEADKLLTKQIKIDRKTNRIRAIDDKTFCADINFDRLQN